MEVREKRKEEEEEDQVPYLFQKVEPNQGNEEKWHLCFLRGFSKRRRKKVKRKKKKIKCGMVGWGENERTPSKKKKERKKMMILDGGLNKLTWNKKLHQSHQPFFFYFSAQDISSLSLALSFALNFRRQTLNIGNFHH